MAGIILTAKLSNVTLEVRTGHSGEPVLIAWGNVQDDRKGRFIDGTYIHTSIIERIEGNLLFTMNSVYEVL